MASHKPKVTFEARQMKRGSDWYVLMRASTSQVHISGFKSETEANRWIATESAEWLKKFEGGRLA
jgi:hypothetical protein